VAIEAPHPGLNGDDIHAEREPETGRRMPKIVNPPVGRSLTTPVLDARRRCLPRTPAVDLGCLQHAIWIQSGSA
jgi:hypothetical protein